MKKYFFNELCNNTIDDESLTLSLGLFFQSQFNY